MAQLTYEQVAKLALDAGFDRMNAPIAVAIARGESGLDPSKTNFKGRDYSYGLMQINMKGELGPERRAQFNLASNEALFDPATNMRVAYGIYLSRKGLITRKPTFTDWTIFNNREYLIYMTAARTAVEKVLGNYEGPDVTDKDNPKPIWEIDNPVDAVQDIGKAAGQFIGIITKQENWFRLASLAGGIILINLVIILIFGDNLAKMILKRISAPAKVAKAVV